MPERLLISLCLIVTVCTACSTSQQRRTARGDYLENRQHWAPSVEPFERIVIEEVGECVFALEKGNRRDRLSTRVYRENEIIETRRYAPANAVQVILDVAFSPIYLLLGIPESRFETTTEHEPTDRVIEDEPVVVVPAEEDVVPIAHTEITVLLNGDTALERTRTTGEGTFRLEDDRVNRYFVRDGHVVLTVERDGANTLEARLTEGYLDRVLDRVVRRAARSSDRDP